MFALTLTADQIKTRHTADRHHLYFTGVADTHPDGNTINACLNARLNSIEVIGKSNFGIFGAVHILVIMAVVDRTHT